MRIIPIINRLKSNAAVFSSRVEPATNLLSLEDLEEDASLPIAFVHALSEKQNENETIGQVEQWGKARFRVMYAAGVLDLDTEEEPLEDAREQVFTALLGWKVDEDSGPIEFVEAEILGTDGRAVYWADTFQYEIYLTD